MGCMARCDRKRTNKGGYWRWWRNLSCLEHETHTHATVCIRLGSRCMLQMCDMDVIGNWIVSVLCRWHVCTVTCANGYIKSEFSNNATVWYVDTWRKTCTCACVSSAMDTPTRPNFRRNKLHSRSPTTCVRVFGTRESNESRHARIAQPWLSTTWQCINFTPVERG